MASTLVGADKIEASLPEIVGGLLRPYFDVFDLFIPPADLVATEIKKMRDNAAGRAIG